MFSAATRKADGIRRRWCKYNNPPRRSRGQKGNEMGIEVVYAPRRKPAKKEPKPKGRMFVGIKMKGRWGNVYENFPLYAFTQKTGKPFAKSLKQWDTKS